MSVLYVSVTLNFTGTYISCRCISYIIIHLAQMFSLGSLLGLYFPHDFCLYPNATAVEVYAIKYIPFIVALTMCTAFGVLTR